MDEKQKVWALRGGLAALGVAVMAVLAPILWAAASAGIALGVVTVVAMLLWHGIPWLGQKLENKILALRKAEARANPIEQLQNFLMEKKKRVDLFRQAVTQIGTQIKSLQDMVAERKREKPSYDASKQEQSIKAMEQAHAVLKTKYKNAEQALQQLHEVIEDKKFEWKFGQAGQQAIQSLNATSGQDLLDQMLADEAFSSVRDNFNQVFAELEMEASKLTEAKQLEFEGGMTLDVSAIRIPEFAQLERR